MEEKPAQEEAYDLFMQGLTVKEIAEKLFRARAAVTAMIRRESAKRQEEEAEICLRRLAAEARGATRPVWYSNPNAGRKEFVWRVDPLRVDYDEAIRRTIADARRKDQMRQVSSDHPGRPVQDPGADH